MRLEAGESWQSHIIEILSGVLPIDRLSVKQRQRFEFFQSLWKRTLQSSACGSFVRGQKWVFTRGDGAVREESWTDALGPLSKLPCKIGASTLASGTSLNPLHNYDEWRRVPGSRMRICGFVWLWWFSFLRDSPSLPPFCRIGRRRRV